MRPIVALLLTMASLCHAAPQRPQYNWTGDGGDDRWSTAGNWAENEPPQTEQAAEVHIGILADIQFDANEVELGLLRMRGWSRLRVGDFGSVQHSLHANTSGGGRGRITIDGAARSCRLDVENGGSILARKGLWIAGHQDYPNSFGTLSIGEISGGVQAPVASVRCLETIKLATSPKQTAQLVIKGSNARIECKRFRIGAGYARVKFVADASGVSPVRITHSALDALEFAGPNVAGKFEGGHSELIVDLSRYTLQGDAPITLFERPEGTTDHLQRGFSRVSILNPPGRHFELSYNEANRVCLRPVNHISSTGLTTYEKWAEFEFDPGDASQPWEDPDGDGFDNLAEYKMGRSPKVSESKLAARKDETGCHLDYGCRQDREDARCTPQRVPDFRTVAGFTWMKRARFKNWTSEEVNITHGSGAEASFARASVVSASGVLGKDTNGDGHDDVIRMQLQFDQARDTSRPPSVLFIVLDDLNDYLGCMNTVYFPTGDPRQSNPSAHLRTAGHGCPEAYGDFDDRPSERVSPSIDALAARGVLFTNAHCAGPICAASRTALLSGLMPSRTGVHANKQLANGYRAALAAAGFAAHPTLPEVFKNHTPYSGRVMGAGKIFHGDDDDSWSENPAGGIYARGREKMPGEGAKFDNQTNHFHIKNFKSSNNSNFLTYRYHDVDPNDLRRLRNRREAVQSGLMLEYELGFNEIAAQLITGNVNTPRSSGDTPSNYNFDWGGIKYPKEEMDDYKVASDAIKALTQAPGTGPLGDLDPAHPFFLATGIFRPHLPFLVPETNFTEVAQDVSFPDRLTYPGLDEYTLYETLGTSTPEYPYRDLSHDFIKTAFFDAVVGTDENDRHVPANFAQADQTKSAIQGYLASIHFADKQVGRLIDALYSTEHGRNTIVVLTSDHGFQFGQKRKWKKSCLWQATTRVPMIVVAPPNTHSDFTNVAKPGSVCDYPVNLVDLYPTLLHMTGIAEVASNEKVSVGTIELDGRSILSLLEKPSVNPNDSDDRINREHSITEYVSNGSLGMAYSGLLDRKIKYLPKNGNTFEDLRNRPDPQINPGDTGFDEYYESVSFDLDPEEKHPDVDGANPIVNPGGTPGSGGGGSTLGGIE